MTSCLANLIESYLKQKSIVIQDGEGQMEAKKVSSGVSYTLEHPEGSPGGAIQLVAFEGITNNMGKSDFARKKQLIVSNRTNSVSC